MIKLHGLLTRGAIHEVEDDAGRGPFIRYDLLNAFEVENVSTPQFDTRLGT